MQIWAAEQTFSNETWYQGTADAVRKQLFEIRSARADYVLILAGDHLYSMDYAKMAHYHWENNADIIVAVQPVANSNSIDIMDTMKKRYLLFMTDSSLSKQCQ